MNCKNMGMLLSQIIDGEVTRDETSTINDHVAQCATCAELYQEMLEVNVHVQRLRPLVVSPGFNAAMVAKLDRASLNIRRKNSIIKISAIAAGLLVVLVTFFMPKLPHEQRTPFITNPNAGLDLKYTPCEDDVSCGNLALCVDLNECGVQYDRVTDWLTRGN